MVRIYLVPSTSFIRACKPSMINKSMVAQSVALFDNLSNFHILTDVIFVRSNIYLLKSTMREKVFTYSKTTLPLFD